MKTKTLELRDRATFIAILAIEMNPDNTKERALLRHCGYACEGTSNILMTRLDGNGKATNDPYEWGDRTMATAHNYIIDRWASLADGDVVDVEFILGETTEPKGSML